MEKWTGGRRSAGDGAGGRRSDGDEAGEEIHRRWGKRRIAVGRHGCPEVEARKKKTTPAFLFFLLYIFYWADKWVIVRVSTYRTSSALIGGSHLSD
jgi:hypothetical protein